MEGKCRSYLATVNRGELGHMVNRDTVPKMSQPLVPEKMFRPYVPIHPVGPNPPPLTVLNL